MRAFALSLWPGLPGLWIRGEWSGLLQAVVFAAGLNFVLVATLVPPMLLPAWSLPFVWGVLVSVWAVCAVRAYRGIAVIGGPALIDEEGLFVQAQDEYLRGHWYEAESILRQQLRRFRGDIEAHLMLAALYRRTRRGDEANRKLRTIQRIDGAEKWRWEIEHERRMLKRLSPTDEEDT